MVDKSTVAYVSATVVAAILAVVGAWFPWVRYRPAGYVDGQPYYTTEYVPGVERSFSALDVAIVSLVVSVVVVVVIAHYFGWQPDAVLILTGGLILLVSGNYLSNYWSVERYEVELGLYLLVVSSLLFILIGCGSVYRRENGYLIGGNKIVSGD